MIDQKLLRKSFKQFMILTKLKPKEAISRFLDAHSSYEIMDDPKNYNELKISLERIVLTFKKK